MTQPVCAYEGCGQPKQTVDRRHNFVGTWEVTIDNHEFQPPSTVESASPLSGAGEQWKPDCDIEAMRNALSKLESQVCRNPDLPEAYKTILRDGFKAVGNIELRLKTGAQGAGEHKCPTCKLPTKWTYGKGWQYVLDGVNIFDCKGAVPGPLTPYGESLKRAYHFRQPDAQWTDEMVVDFCEMEIKRLATPEPHSPHVHNFDANGICVTMGCTPAIPAAASTDERPSAEYFYRSGKYEGDEDFSNSSAFQFAEAYAADLLRLVAELRGDLKTVNEAWHADLVQWGQEQKAAKARAEQAERERDRLAGLNPTP